MTLKGLIFDFDGLILDTETPEYQAWAEIYHRYGAELDISTWGQVIGTSPDKFDPVTHLEKITGTKLSHLDLRTQHRARSNELTDQLIPLPGVENLLALAKQAGIKLAIASSSDRNWVEGRLIRSDLIHWFDCIRTANDVPVVKPAPDLYRHALNGLGLQPKEAIAFEDSPNGITAAQAAGIYCIAIPNEITKFLPIQHADKIVSSLNEISLDELSQFINYQPN